MPDITISPVYIPDLISGALDLLIDGERGIWHLSNRAQLSLAELANRLTKETGLNALSASGEPQHNPRSFALTSRRGWITPTVASAISRFARACSLQSIACDSSGEIQSASALSEYLDAF